MVCKIFFCSKFPDIPDKAGRKTRRRRRRTQAIAKRYVSRKRKKKNDLPQICSFRVTFIHVNVLELKQYFHQNRIFFIKLCINSIRCVKFMSYWSSLTSGTITRTFLHVIPSHSLHIEAQLPWFNQALLFSQLLLYGLMAFYIHKYKYRRPWWPFTTTMCSLM